MSISHQGTLLGVLERKMFKVGEIKFYVLE
jgi:hypothetical protein